MLARRGVSSRVQHFSTRPLAAFYSPPPLSEIEKIDVTAWSPQDLSKVDETYLLPPPNVTGKLHMGHALTVTIQDAVVRYKRLRGKQVRWVYGLDHAGIATQSVVERHLNKTEKLTKYDLGRDAFVDKVWEWTNDHRKKIKSQLLLLGASLDYDREYFTLDNNHSRAVTEAFVRLHEKGLLKRARRMVNWCPQLRTALSDLEVDKMELTGPTELIFPGGIKGTFGIADDFAYRVQGTDEEIVVRTTRLETMLGDVAVAVHPEDLRYKHLIGQFVFHPFFPNRLLPIVGDDKLVDMNVGTGAVKITPAHDPFDFECARRIKLPVGDCIFTEDGKLNPDVVPREFASIHRFQGRERVRQKLEEMGLYRGRHSHPLALGRCSRTGDVIEPILKWQWFLDGSHLAQTAQTAVSQQQLSIFPPEQRGIWNMWLKNAQDWCVSRQLWWGHRIPAYRKVGGDESDWIVARNDEEAQRILGCEMRQIERDEDVLDTWFSSALLPISVYGWPDKSSIKEQLAWMETGSDILFFWVARMVMMCTELNNGLLPFPHVHLHSMVRDKRGRKMSKSLGNVIDPLDVIKGISLDEMLQGLASGNLDSSEVARAAADLREQFGKTDGMLAYGADALRLALASYPATVPQVLFDLERVAQARLFCNKMWQATRFVLGRHHKTAHQGDDTHVRWIRHRLSTCVTECSQAYERMDVEAASSAAKRFFWNDLCDVFLECAKLDIHPEQEAKALEDCLKASYLLLHPIAPNITAELWGHVATDSMQWNERTLPPFSDIKAEQDMNLCLDIVRAIRALKVRFGSSAKRFEVSIESAPSLHMMELAKRLSRIEWLSVEKLSSETIEQDKSLLEPLTCTVGIVRITGATEGLGKLIQAEVDRIIKRQSALQKSIEAEKARMNSPSFVAKAPENVRAKTLERLRSLEAEFEALNIARKNINGGR